MDSLSSSNVISVLSPRRINVMSEIIAAEGASTQSWTMAVLVCGSEVASSHCRSMHLYDLALEHFRKLVHGSAFGPRWPR